MWQIIYVCPFCNQEFGHTAEFSHDHSFDEPEVTIEKRICPNCEKERREE